MFNFHLDWWLVIPSILLLLISFIVLRSVAPDLVKYQVAFALVAGIFFLAFSFTDYHLPFAFAYPAYGLSVLFLLTPYLFGIHARGTLRWLQFGQFNLQPSEVVKPILLIAFSVLATSSLKHRLLLLPAMFIIPWVIIFFQPDLGTSLVLAVGWIIILLSQLRIRTILALGLGLLVLIAPIVRFSLKPYQKERLITFINPYKDPLDRGYHVIQSLIAVGSGEIVGRGLGQGTQSQLRFLPERHTDFVFASLSEELGFVGSFLVISLLLILLWRIYKIFQNATQPEASVFCLAALVMLAFQAFVNIGMNMGLAPITGVTLPFLSYGGSSLLSLGITLGLVNSISSSQPRDSLI